MRRSGAKFLILFFCSLSSLPIRSSIALAAPSKSQISLMRPQAEKEKFSPVSTFELLLEQTQYLSDSTNTSNLSSTGLLGLQIKHLSGEEFKKVADVKGHFYFSESRTPYAAVSELYLRGPFFGDKAYFVIGREKKMWSRTDELWHLGLWQPLARWDYFRPESQGLTGVTLGLGSPKGGVELFASGLFLPDQGPQFQLVDGKFQSDNRWFWQPQTEAQILGGPRELNYELVTPSVNETIQQPSFAARLWGGEFQQGGWASIAYAYKPMNQLHLSIDPQYNIGANQPSEPIVGILPRVVKHHLATAEVGTGSKEFYGWISATGEKVEKPSLPSRYLQASLSDSAWFSVGIGHTLGWKDFEVLWSYLRRNSWNENRNSGLIASENNVESSFDRFPIDEAASLGWAGNLMQSGSQSLRWRSHYWYSFEERGSWISSGLDWRTSSSFVWHLSLDVLGTDLDEQDTRGMISRYRGNDRVALGFTHVF